MESYFKAEVTFQVLALRMKDINNMRIEKAQGPWETIMGGYTNDVALHQTCV
jgi:hypothetical protein